MGGGKRKKDGKKGRPSQNAPSQEVRGVIGQKDKVMNDSNYRPNAPFSQQPISNYPPMRNTPPSNLNLLQTHFVPLKSPTRSDFAKGDSAKNHLNHQDSPIGQSFLHGSHNIWTPPRESPVAISSPMNMPYDHPYYDDMMDSREVVRLPILSSPDEFERSSKSESVTPQQASHNHKESKLQYMRYMSTNLPSGVEIPEADYDDPTTAGVRIRQNPPVPPPKGRHSGGAYSDHSLYENDRQSNHGSWSSGDSVKMEAARRYVGVGAGAALYDKELQQKVKKNYSPALNDGEFGKGVDPDNVPRKTHMTMINAKRMARMVCDEIDHKNND